MMPAGTMHGTLSGVTHPVAAVSLRYVVAPVTDDWILPEGTVPESTQHDATAQHLKHVLDSWARRCGRNVRAARNLAIRWLEDRPQIGIDPDVCVLEPAPDEFDDLGALCLWKPGHVSPSLCFEIVSKRHPHKDYTNVQDRYAAIACRELFVFDPLLAGPASLGGPVPLQVWQRDTTGVFERVHFGDEPAYSFVLDAWVLPRGRLLEIADDRAGENLWLTAEDHERAEKERERVEKERERAEKERERAEKERERAEKERERSARMELEARVGELEKKARG